ncbi:hypothetical protein K2173_015324 [Erythroxylum novogranatense]|uniref:Uncharacterized protein n=1 Tax=Erythroxylum novogranatense TaxID=1862640 RepID=A0AAV8T1M4_9ROSI|nr:hypothetical protein K2173_015324 [Erythroxylum novogranatense]
MQRESQTTQLAFVTFKDARGADMGSTVADHSVTITPAKDYMLPPEAAALITDQKLPATDSAFRRAADLVTTVLAKGFVLGKDAINKAKSLDERTHLTANASATVSSIDRKMSIRDKISHGTAIANEKAKSAFSVAEQVASNAGSAVMSNRYILTGASWISGAISAVAKAAEDVSMMTKEKIEKAEENKKATLVRDRTEVMNDSPKLHLGEPPKGEPPVVAAVRAFKHLILRRRLL